MNILSAFTAYPLPAGYNASQPTRAPAKPDNAGDEGTDPPRTIARMDFLPARPDDDELASQAGTALPGDISDEIRSFLTTANNSDEQRIGRFLDIQA